MPCTSEWQKVTALNARVCNLLQESSYACEQAEDFKYVVLHGQVHEIQAPGAVGYDRQTASHDKQNSSSWWPEPANHPLTPSCMHCLRSCKRVCDMN